MLSSTVSIVVCFHPDESFDDLLRVLVEATDHVIIVDNTPSAPVLGLAAYDSCPGVTTIRWGRNRGLSEGLNRGIDEATALGAEAVVLWDQDSRPSLTTFRHLFDAYRRFERGPFIFSACAVDRTIDADTRTAPYPVRRAITSGLLIHHETLAAVGPFRSDFRIDMVDFDFSLRATAAGYTIMRIPQATFDHRLGDPAQSKRLWGKFQSSGHPPWRHYWIARNSTILYREHQREQHASVRELRHDRHLWFLNAIAAGPRRVATGVALWRGLRDGRSGRVTARYDLRDI
jgi:rhamnosyltransferase